MVNFDANEVHKTTKQVKKLLAETIREARELLAEYAVKRKDFKELVSNRLPQIVQNWGLIYYANLTQNETFLRNANHWKSELKAHIYYICDHKIKGKENNAEHKLKAILEVINDRDYDDSTQNIDRALYEKFLEEGINPREDDNYSKVIEAWFDAYPTLSKLMSIGNIEEIITFVDEKI